METLSDKGAALIDELASTRDAFHTLLESMSDEDLGRQSLNPGWTNGEVFFHLVLAYNLVPFLVPLLGLFSRLPDQCSRLFARALDAGTGLFNLVNGLGPRGGARILTRDRLLTLFDRRNTSIMKMVASTKDQDWTLGMHYPERWEPLFGEFMTLEDVVRYPTIHFRFHVDQLSR